MAGQGRGVLELYSWCLGQFLFLQQVVREEREVVVPALCKHYFPSRSPACQSGGEGGVWGRLETAGGCRAVQQLCRTVQGCTVKQPPPASSRRDKAPEKEVGRHSTKQSSKM